MATIVALLRGCMESFKSILTSQDFGSEYELLCTQLSVQWLRIRLWGESVGLHIELDSPLNDAIFERPDVQATVNRSISNIAYLLTEIEALRRKYEVKPRLEALPEYSNDEAKSNGSSRSLSFSRPISSLRQRIRDNQKQKSFLAITKWSICDAKKFDEKVKQLKVLIDGLEDITRAATFTQAPARISTPTPLEENPPPYSEVEQGRRRTLQHTALGIASTQPISAGTSEDRSLLPHYHTFKIFLAGLSASPEPPRLRPREKLIRLTDFQLKELRIDIYDDLIRRQHHSSTVQSLPPNISYHPKRNQAREKLSTLLPHRFRHLVSDVTSEINRRFPDLEDAPTTFADPARDPLGSPLRQAERRYGYVLPHDSPPSALLHSRPLHRGTLTSDDLSKFEAGFVTPNRTSSVMGQANGPALTSDRTRLTSEALSRIDENSTSTAANRTSEFARQVNGHNSTSSLPTSTFSTSAFPSRTISINSNPSTPSVEIFKSFRVSMDDCCSKVLPAALKKYNISASPEDYALYILYGDKERCLGWDEKPLIIFKALQREGKKPMFMLRKTASPFPEIAGEAVARAPEPLEGY